MSVQTNLFPDTPDPSSAVAVDGPKRTAVAPIWLQRVSLLILVFFCVLVGLILTVLPWLTSIWDHNLLLQSSPRVWSVMRVGFVRGLVSGLGLLDVWIGVSEALHYRDDRG